MPNLPLNPDLPISYQVPGVYVFNARAGSAPATVNRRVILLGYKTSAGTAVAGTLLRILSEDDIVAAAGKGSDLHRMYRALIAQSSSTGGEIWAMPMNAPSGTAQTRTITFLQSPSGGTLGTGNTGAVDAGFHSLWICGYRYDTQIASGDTYDTIAANVAATIAADQDNLPCTVSVAGSTVTLTMRHAALTSADFPIMSAFSSTSMAVSASPGTVTIGGPATGAGSVGVRVATQTAATTFANTDTANAITATVITAVNTALAFPVSAAQPSTPGAVVTLFFVDGRVYNWNSTFVTTGAGVTVTPSWGANGSGLPSSSTPSLSSVLTLLEAQEAFRLWLTPFTGLGATVTTSGLTQSGSVSDTSVLSTLATHIERFGNGLYCKGQILALCDTRSLAVAGTHVSSTTPSLTLSPRYFAGWAPASPQQAVESAARMVGLVLSRLDYPNFNYAGQALLTDTRTPYLLPHAATRPSDNDVNAAMLSYYLTPLRANASGQMTVVSGRTTAKPSATLDASYSFWGVALADDYIRDDLRAVLPEVMRGKNLKTKAPTNTQFTIDESAVRTAIADRMIFYNTLDIFDGVDDLTPGLQAEVNIYLAQRIDVKMPKRFAKPAEQISIYTALAA